MNLRCQTKLKKRLDGHPRFLEYVRLEIFYGRLLFNFLPNLATLDFYKISFLVYHYEKSLKKATNIGQKWKQSLYKYAYN